MNCNFYLYNELFFIERNESHLTNYCIISFYNLLHSVNQNLEGLLKHNLSELDDYDRCTFIKSIKTLSKT